MGEPWDGPDDAKAIVRDQRIERCFEVAGASAPEVDADDSGLLCCIRGAVFATL